MNIYTLLSSKPHNPHYLNRYTRFIEACQQKNVDWDGYVERHHICPKADDMFPQYKDFKEHPWNKVKLTARQHFIAHMILWKCFPNITSCIRAIWGMKCRSFNKKIHSKLYEKMRTEAINDLSLSKIGFCKPGRKFTEEHRRNLSKSAKGKKKSKQHRKSLSESIIKNNTVKGKNHPRHKYFYITPMGVFDSPAALEPEFTMSRMKNYCINCDRIISKRVYRKCEWLKKKYNYCELLDKTYRDIGFYVKYS